MRVLLSIKPEFAERIFSGEKRFEYRKSIFKREVSTVVVYVTQPVGMIVGEFNVGQVLHGDPAEIWEATKSQSGISRDFFGKYFLGRSRGYAIEVKKPRKYKKAFDPSLKGPFTPPQSFCYLCD